MVGRAGRGAERPDLGAQPFEQLALAGQQRARLLEQERLVGRAAALGDEHQVELVGVVVAGGRRDVELHRQVVAGVHFVEHRERRHLRVAQVGLAIGAGDAFRQRVLLVALDPDALALLAEHDRGAGVLAHRQLAAGGDVGVAQEVDRHEPVVRRGFRVVEDAAQLRQVSGAQQVRHVAEGGARKRGQRRGRHPQDRAAVAGGGRDSLDRQLPIRRGIRAEREEPACDIGGRQHVQGVNPCVCGRRRGSRPAAWHRAWRPVRPRPEPEPRAATRRRRRRRPRAAPRPAARA